jgi:WD40 repeat protein
LIRWDQQTNTTSDAKVIATSEDVFFDLEFSPNGKELAAAAADGSIRLFDIPSGAQRQKINNHADWVTNVSFSPNSKLIATASRDKAAKVFDVDSGALVATYSRHKAPVRAVTFAPDGKSVVSAAGVQLHIWNVQDANLAGEMSGCEGEVEALLTFGDKIVSASADRTCRLFKLKDRTTVRALMHPTPAISLAGHEPTHRLSIGCFDGSVTVWDSEKGTMIKQFSGLPITTKQMKLK